MERKRGRIRKCYPDYEEVAARPYTGNFTSNQEIFVSSTRELTESEEMAKILYNDDGDLIWVE